MFDVFSPAVPAAFAQSFAQIENAHLRLARRVKEMSQAELEYTGPAGNVNATATLAAHVAYTDLIYLYQIKGEPIPADLEAEMGMVDREDGTLPPVTGKTAAELLERCARVVAMVREYLQTQTDPTRAVKVEWWPEPATMRYVLWHMACHTGQHVGQIDRLRAFYAQER